MRDHVAGRDVVDRELKRAATELSKAGGDVPGVLAHRLLVGQAAGRPRIMLSLPETTVVAADQNLHLPPPLAIGAQDVEIGIAGDPVEGRLELLAVPHRSAAAQIQWNGSRHRETAANGRIDGGIDRGRPASAGQTDHMEVAIAWDLS